jgi:hypothetical protein
MKNWMVALVALAMGGAVSAALLVFADTSRGTVDAYAVTQDLASGTDITRAVLPNLSPLRRRLIALFTWQRSPDHGRAPGPPQATAAAQRWALRGGGGLDERLVFVPNQDAPPRRRAQARPPPGLRHGRA